MEINKEEILKTFKSFLSAKDHTKLSEYKAKKFKFLLNIIQNKKMFSTYQLCSTSIAKEYGVCHTTASNWIIALIKCGVLVRTNKKYLPGFRSMTYKFNKKSDLVDYINSKNGFYDRYSEGMAKSKKKQEYREDSWEGFDEFSFSYTDALKLQNSYRGCLKSFEKDVLKHIRQDVLNAPSEFNIFKNNAWMLFKAFQHGQKVNGYTVPSESESKLVELHGKAWCNDFNFYTDSDVFDKEYLVMNTRKHIGLLSKFLHRAGKNLCRELIRKYKNKIKSLKRLLRIKLPSPEINQERYINFLNMKSAIDYSFSSFHKDGTRKEWRTGILNDELIA